MRKMLTVSLAAWIAALGLGSSGMLATGPAQALDKVDPYICPTMDKGSGTDCFLEAIPQTYTMCRHIKSIEVIEYGMAGIAGGRQRRQDRRLH